MPERRIDNLKITRRDLFTAGAGAGAALLLDNLVQPTPETKNGKELLNTILKLDPYSPERLLNEAAYVSQAESLDQIDQGFWVVSSKELRALLLHKRSKLRESGELVKNLQQEEYRWAEDQNIHPEVLSICKDNYPIAKEAIKQLFPILRPDLNAQATDPESLIINIGGITRLMAEETGYNLGGRGTSYAFCYIGEREAAKQINPNIFPTGKRALSILCKNLSRDSGLNFIPETVPGSTRGSGDESGGAIGVQFMPDNALDIYNLLKGVGIKFNPFDPSAVVGVWVFLAKKGYFKNDEAQIRNALAGWNPKGSEIETVYQAALDYYAKFLR